MKTTVIYFSPAGGTKTVANLIIDEFKAQPIDMTVSVLPSFFNSDELVFFLVPVYGGRIPKPVNDRMKLMQGDGTPAVVMAVYGNRGVDDALLEMKNLAVSKGFKVFAAGEMIAPHSLDNSFGAGRPDASDKDKLSIFLAQVKETTTYSDISVPGNPKYKAYAGVPVRPMVIRKNCTGCGICMDTCPTDAIYLKLKGKNDHSRTEILKCISCMHCVNVCASDARKIPLAEKATIHAALNKVAADRKEPKFYI